MSTRAGLRWCYRGRSVLWLKRFGEALDLQIKRDKNPEWHNLDDKWVFPRAKLQQIADDTNAELIIYPTHSPVMPFKNYILYCLTTFENIPISDVPAWALDIIDRVDTDLFSADGLKDMLLTGCVIFRKR